MSPVKFPIFGFFAILTFIVALAWMADIPLPVTGGAAFLATLIFAKPLYDRWVAKNASTTRNRTAGPDPSATETDIDVAARFTFSRARLAAHLATERGGSAWLSRLFLLIREHERDLLDLNRSYSGEFAFQDIVAYQRELDQVRTGSRKTVPNRLTQHPLHHR